MTPDSGHLKVLVGMAAGVGKTYRMLQEGHDEVRVGRDVVIGYLETHGRVQTAAAAEGLELLPRRKVPYRETALWEMDLPAILARAPELCLIDELAHTNAPGTEHAKRYEDVRDVIAAGIDVIATVNVQHLESLNDQVTQLTGTRVRETIPDVILAQADEVVLIDLTPETLIARLQAGNVYPPDRIPSALNNFFKIENLAALRETALRQVAEGVESKRLHIHQAPVERPGAGQREDRMLSSVAPLAISERLLALVTTEPASQRVVRRACRSAQRLGAELDLLVVRPPGREPNAMERDRMGALTRLASVLGAHLLVREGDDVAQTAITVARERGSTYVLIGTSRAPHGLRRLVRPISDRSLPTRLLKGLPGVDVRIVADPTLRGECGPGGTGERATNNDHQPGEEPRS